MNSDRTIEDNLRAEYFKLLPKMRRTLVAVETSVRYLIRDVAINAEGHKHERVIVTSRLKECESAIAKRRRKLEGGTFDPGKLDQYSLSTLHDLVGVRVMAFPPTRLDEVCVALQPLVRHWRDDPVKSSTGETLAFKYNGIPPESGTDVEAEVQITSVLIGGWWEIEHSALYKPSPHLRNLLLKGPNAVKECANDVLVALRAFEQAFDRVIREDESYRSDSGSA